MLKASSDEVVREMFALREKSRRDEISRLHNAEQEGRAKEKLETVKKTFNEGISLEIISKLTGLSIGYLKKLSKKDV